MPFLLPFLAGSVAGSGIYYVLTKSLETSTGNIVLSLHDVSLDLADCLPLERESKLEVKQKTRLERQKEELHRLRMERERHLPLSLAVKESWNRHLLLASLSLSEFFRKTDWPGLARSTYEQGKHLVSSARDELEGK